MDSLNRPKFAQEITTGINKWDHLEEKHLLRKGKKATEWRDKRQNGKKDFGSYISEN